MKRARHGGRLLPDRADQARQVKKADQDARVEATREALRDHPASYPVTFFTSSRTGEGIPELRAHIARLVGRAHGGPDAADADVAALGSPPAKVTTCCERWRFPVTDPPARRARRIGRAQRRHGPNGSGKSSLYRRYDCSPISRKGGHPSLALEGGLSLTLWAGPEWIGRAVRQGRFAVERRCPEIAGQPQAGYSGRRLRLCHRSRHAASLVVAIRPGSGNQGGRRVDWGSARSSQRAGDAGRTAQSSACGRVMRRSGGRPTRASRLSTA